MEKFWQVLNKKVKDETAAFAILSAIVITFAVTIGAYEYIRYTKSLETNSFLLGAMQEGSNLGESELSNEILNSVINEEEAKKENEEEFEKLKKEKKISSAADKYYIKVNYGAQVVNVYTKDSNGKYTKMVRAMVCSTGRYTPTGGVYRTLGKGNWWPLMGDVYGQYSTWICGDILFHSVPYLESGNKSSLEYWAYDQLGQRVSMGCVRLTVEDAKWIYSNCPVGTQVEFYSSSNPGPWGKPTTRKISNAPSYVRGWDPTDPDKRNPWPKYLKELENKKDDDKNNDKTNTVDKDNNTIISNTVPDNDVNDTYTNDTSTNIVEGNVINDVEDTNIVEPENNSVEDINNTIDDSKEGGTS